MTKIGGTEAPTAPSIDRTVSDTCNSSHVLLASLDEWKVYKIVAPNEAITVFATWAHSHSTPDHQPFTVKPFTEIIRD